MNNLGAQRGMWNDDCLSFEKLQLRIPAHQHSCHLAEVVAGHPSLTAAVPVMAWFEALA
ncbi:hypothetical protein [Candidatus Nitrotoga arctica]|uniref:hypothetical protein n=1 Tax=Candidatus Nitrotoga arctica TaxID=453162 RepID=UPI001EFBEFAC|nr:hypothetical protein [Candidatus Nitrotoga arctica]